MYKNIKYFLILLLLNIHCSRSQESVEKCKEAFTKASKEINSFALDKDENKLKKALKYLEVSISCEQTKLMAIELKVATLNTLSRYKENVSFIESLKINDFDKPYKKEMYLNFFRAKLCQDNINCRKQYFMQAINSIESYLKTNKDFDENVYYDLFTVKSEILTTDELSGDIEDLIMTYPDHREYLETLESTFNKDEDTSVSE